MIRDARRRQRRRRASVATALAAAALVAAIIGSGGLDRRQAPQLPSGPHSGVPRFEAPSAVFVQDPYMGVSCHLPNSIACDRVGLSVWLARAARVTATIAGAHLTLNDRNWSYVAHSGRRRVYVYAGFLRPAGLTTRLHVIPESRTQIWLGSNAPSPLVRFRIDYGHGDVVVTRERVWLSAGWG